MSINQHNKTYSGGFPTATGDRNYSQDMFRDFHYLLEKSGLAIEDIIQSVPFLAFGGYVVKGTNWDDIDIQAAVGYHEYDVTSPDSFASIPPTTKTDTLRAQRVESTAQTDFDISGATLDGSTVNYLKLEFVTTNGNSRARAKKAGSYNYELVDSFLFTADSTPGTSKQVTVCTFIGDGASFFTPTNIEPVNIAKLFLDKVFQDDSRNSIIQPASTTLWEFSSPGLMNSAGVIPEKLSEITYIDSLDANAKFSNRGVLYIDAGGILVYDHTLANQGIIAFRYKPIFTYTTASDKYIIDTRSLSGNTENAFVMFYNAATDQIIVQIFDDGSNWITLSTAAFVSDVSLQVWHDIFINFNTAGTADMYLNGAIQGKAISATGITNADFTQRDKLSIGCQYLSAASALGADCGEFYIADLLISSVYSADVSNYNGTGSVKPNYSDNRIAGKNHNYVLDEYGNQGLTSLSCQAIDNGAGFEKTYQVEIGSWDMVSDSTKLIPLPLDLINAKQLIFWNTQIWRDDLVDIQSTEINTVGSFGEPGGSMFFSWGASKKIGLNRAVGGKFDDSFYNDVTINRGWVTIKYLV